MPNFQTAVYQLAIRAPAPPYPLVASYTFPLTPESFRKEYAAMSNFYDVAGSPAQAGVQRIVDTYGDSPVTFVLEGTTGWSFHSSDGYSMTGLQSIQSIQNFLNYYAQLNQIQVQNHVPDLYILEFYDYFAGNFWQVVPVGRQGLVRNVRRPLLASYYFRLVGIASLSAPPGAGAADPIAAAFSVGAAQGLATFQGQVSATLSNYAGVS